MRRTGNALVFVLCGTTLFLGGCLVGVAAQHYLDVAQSESKPVVEAAARQAEEHVFAEPLVHRPVKTIVVRADGSFAEPVNN